MKTARPRCSNAGFATSKRYPVWDGDKFIFNFVLHPYAYAAYYMSARSCGFNYWGSFVYCFCISTFFWEYGFEAFNEIPSAQDIVVTSVVGSIMGEAFYHAKRHIMSNGYRIFGSRALGYVAAFFAIRSTKSWAISGATSAEPSDTSTASPEHGERVGRIRIQSDFAHRNALRTDTHIFFLTNTTF